MKQSNGQNTGLLIKHADKHFQKNYDNNDDKMTTGNKTDILIIIKKLTFAIFYGLSSIMMVFVNKILLTNLNFPSFLFLGIGQMIMTIVLLFFARFFGIVKFPPFDSSIPKRMFPLPFFYILNLIAGLGATQKTNLPMFTVLRRFSILMTLILEFLVLDIRPTFIIKICVFLMILGSLIAGISDLTFNAFGYIYVFLNNIFTAANGVLHLGKYGLLYYNSFLMVVPTLLVTILFTDDVKKFQLFIQSEGLSKLVITCFIISNVCGFVLNYSFVLCSTYNSALTTSCIGPIKNLFVTYSAMIFSYDYVFNWPNFLGVNISVFGSVVYTYVTFFSPSSSSAKSSKKHHKITIIPTVVCKPSSSKQEK